MSPTDINLTFLEMSTVVEEAFISSISAGGSELLRIIIQQKIIKQISPQT